MNRSLPNRLSACLLAALFLLSWSGDAFGLHPCPHHDAAAGAHPAPQPHPASHADGRPGGAHHADDVPGGHAAERSAPAPSHDGHGGGCTCVGACDAGPAAATLPGARVVPAAAPSAEDAAAPERTSPLPRFRPYVLPYGHAPPTGG